MRVDKNLFENSNLTHLKFAIYKFKIERKRMHIHENNTVETIFSCYSNKSTNIDNIKPTANFC